MEMARKLFKVCLLASTAEQRASALLGWAQLEKSDGNISKARELLKRALKAEPTNSRLVYSLGKLERAIGKYREAARLFETALALHKNAQLTAEIRLEWALMEKRQRQDASSARALLEAAIPPLEAMVELGLALPRGMCVTLLAR